jgi:hypothetical protein
VATPTVNFPTHDRLLWPSARRYGVSEIRERSRRSLQGHRVKRFTAAQDDVAAQQDVLHGDGRQIEII